MHYIEDKTDREISRWLWETYKIKISPEALRQHFKNHSKIPDDAKKQYEERQAALSDVAGKIVDELAILDQLILDELETHGMVKVWVSKLFEPMDPHIDKSTELPYIPMSLVSMDQGTIAEIRQLIKTKSDLMNGDLKGTEAKMITEAMKKVHEHRKQRLNGPGGGLRGAGFGGKK